MFLKFAMLRRLAFGKNPGQTLVEVVIAILLIAIVAAAILSVVMSAQIRSQASETKDQVALSANQLLQQLKGYVTNDCHIMTVGPNPPPPPPPPLRQNPDPSFVCNNLNWHLQGDVCGAGLPVNCWALEQGNHNVTQSLPAELQSAPYNATLIYTVAYPCRAYSSSNPNGPLCPPQVSVTLDWTPPKL